MFSQVKLPESLRPVQSEEHCIIRGHIPAKLCAYEPARAWLVAHSYMHVKGVDELDTDTALGAPYLVEVSRPDPNA